ncbi:hypothetical protein PLCT2_00735 [Planctomycetaceae bacterium]|nr:hypothetical protein PLCT2_00735 [Planctomycetaceae bacterium]
MYTPSALLDMHARSQKSLRGLIAHCGSLTSEELERHLLDFGLPPHGEPSVRLQLTHTIGAQRYWLGVLQGRMEAEDPVLANIAEIEAFRESVAAAVTRYLEGANDAELNTPRSVKTFHDERVLMPARVIVRTLVHIYDHKGKVAAMCRHFGKPIQAGLDFPLL